MPNSKCWKIDLVTMLVHLLLAGFSFSVKLSSFGPETDWPDPSSTCIVYLSVLLALATIKGATVQLEMFLAKGLPWSEYINC